ncbi:hypothetical protein C7212DRAFT_346306 [Tuber magnatum]|uniref:Uncharacterized protein n=1 Tax=Tuber magnatum TaxID=42249 RepID=A0A317SII2_9PEZI|nr:hypothetical protein C7212DRAFT_346306 [Tuber magnatum]
MATKSSRIPLPTFCTSNRRKQPRYHRSHKNKNRISPNLPPKAWEILIQSRQTARQDRVWENEEQERIRAFEAAREEHESLSVHFLFESGNQGHEAVNTRFSGDGIADHTSVLLRRGVEGQCQIALLGAATLRNPSLSGVSLAEITVVKGGGG